MITDETQAYSALPHSVVWCVWSPVQYLSSCVWRQGGGCYHRVICPVLTHCLKWLLRDFFSPFDYFWRVILVWFCYGLYIMNTNIPRLFIFIKNKAVLYIRTSFIFHSVCRLSNSFPSSMSQCWKSRNGIVIKQLFFFYPTSLIAISLLLSVRPSSAIRAIRYWHTSHNVTDTLFVEKQRLGERERKKKERQGVPLLTAPVVLDTLSIWFHPNTAFDPLSSTGRLWGKELLFALWYTAIRKWRPTNSHVAPSAAWLW